MSNKLTLYSSISTIDVSDDLTRKSKGFLTLLAYPISWSNTHLIDIITPFLKYEDEEKRLLALKDIDLKKLTLEKLRKEYIPLTVDHIDSFVARIPKTRNYDDVTIGQIKEMLLEALENTQREENTGC